MLSIKAFTYKYAEYNGFSVQLTEIVWAFPIRKTKPYTHPKPILTPTKLDFVTSRHDSIRLATLVIVISVMQYDTFHKSLARAGCQF